MLKCCLSRSDRGLLRSLSRQEPSLFSMLRTIWWWRWDLCQGFQRHWRLPHTKLQAFTSKNLQLFPYPSLNCTTNLRCCGSRRGSPLPQGPWRASSDIFWPDVNSDEGKKTSLHQKNYGDLPLGGMVAETGVSACFTVGKFYNLMWIFNLQ